MNRLERTRKAFLLSALLVGLSGILITHQVFAQDISGNNNMSASDSGVAINGNVSDTNVLNNQNNISTGSNLNQNSLNNTTSNVNTSVNQNLLQPVLIAPSSSSGGSGGDSLLVMPRNPLPLPNANLGRSNFGMQFGLQNNPGLSSLSGSNNALGWFMQAGLTIPFGKIPEPYRNSQNIKIDDYRQNMMDKERQVLGTITPDQARANTRTAVQGRVLGLPAYNYSTIPSAKLSPHVNELDSFGAVSRPTQPKLLALVPGEAYSRPLNTGDKVGVIEVGKEYPYLGHTRSGWIKILLPGGSEAWTNTSFEFIKFDYTEIDTLADTTAPVKATRKEPIASKPAPKHR